jgi:hypothetical protein
MCTVRLTKAVHSRRVHKMEREEEAAGKKKRKPEIVREVVEGDLAVGAVGDEPPELLLQPLDGDPIPRGRRAAGGPRRGGEAEPHPDADADPQRRHEHALPLHGVCRRRSNDDVR